MSILPIGRSASAALILVADTLAEKWIFKDGILLQPEDISKYLVSKESVNQNGRALQFLYDFININQARFSPDMDKQGEIWGDMDDNYVYIIRSKFDQILADNGYNASAFLGWAKGQGILYLGNDGKLTRVRKLNGKSARCICIKLDNSENNFDENEESWML